MFVGTVHGVALNDQQQLQQLALAFESAPHNRPPSSPVLYIKPRNCISSTPSTVIVDDGLCEVEVAATLGLLFGVDACRETPERSLRCVAGACLALDISEPRSNFYRPAVRQLGRDGFLPLGEVGAFNEALLGQEIRTWVNGVLVHRWTGARLLRSAAQLIAEISAFQTLSAGDLLLVGLPGDAPRVRRGDRLQAATEGLASVCASFVGASL